MIDKLKNGELTLKKVADLIGATLPDSIDGDAKIGRVLTQSVYTSPGDVIISVKWYPAEKTINEALEKGAIAVFCDQSAKEKFPQDNVIAVDDPLDCVYQFEIWRSKDCHAKRITITGSVGKTTTTGLIDSVIANSFPTLTHHPMANSHGAVLRNVQNLDKTHEYWVQEVGAVQPHYIETTAKFLRPNIVVYTNIGESHLNRYFTQENILADKLSLDRFAQPDGVVIINSDDAMLNSAVYMHRVIRCSLKDPNADYYACDLRTELDGLHFTVKYKGGSGEVHLNLYGDFNAYNALFAIACGHLAGLKTEQILPLLETYYPSGMRQNLVRVGGYTFFVDCFNAEPQTVLGSAKTLVQMRGIEGGRKIFVTGHIDLLGENSVQMHADLGRGLAKLDLDLVVLFAGDSIYTYQTMLECGAKNAILMHSREELDAWLENNITYKDIVFFKSGHYEASLAKTVDHVLGTAFQNEQQYNNGRVVVSNGFKFRLRQDNIAELEAYTGSEKNVVIPEKYEDFVMTRIAPHAFAKHYDLTSVEIPDSVTTIGAEAFYICPRLKSVKLPKKLKFIGDNAFNYCKSLKHVEIPPNTIHLGRKAFFDCLELETAIIPNAVGFIGELAFDVEKPLKDRSLHILCSRGSYADGYAQEHHLQTSYLASDDERVLRVLPPMPAPAAAESVPAPAPVKEPAPEKKTVAHEAVTTGCKMSIEYIYDLSQNSATVIKGGINTESVILPATIEGKPLSLIDVAAFKSREGLKRVVINGKLDKIAYLAFFGCKSLEEFTINGSVTQFERSAINSCPRLRVIRIPEGTKKINRLAFGYCQSLEKLYLPNSLTDIAPDILEGSPNAVIYCNKGSYAETFAKEQKISFVAE